MKNLLISSVDLLGWDDARTWAVSLRESGYDGEAAVITYRVNDPNFSAFSKELNIDLLPAEQDYNGQPINHQEQPHHKTTVNRNRFFHMAWYLMQRPTTYDWVISTDLRDVVFQKNPNEFLEIWESEPTAATILASSEGQLYRNEPWNAGDQQHAHGPIVWGYRMRNAVIHNAGVIAVRGHVAADLFLNIFFACKHNKQVAGDQAVYNLLLETAYRDKAITMTHNTPWACQCHSAFSSPQLQETFVEPLPYIKNGLCYTRNEEPFTIVHQYDRIPELKSAVGKRYGV